MKKLWMYLIWMLGLVPTTKKQETLELPPAVKEKMFEPLKSFYTDIDGDNIILSTVKKQEEAEQAARLAAEKKRLDREEKLSKELKLPINKAALEKALIFFTEQSLNKKTGNIKLGKHNLYMFETD